MSYHKDSRNENVELDYNNLRIASPTTFTKSVDFSGSPMVSGTTFPRGICITTTTPAYIANNELNPVLPSAYGLNEVGSNTFASLQPQLTYTDYITFNTLGTDGKINIHIEGYYYISAVVQSDTPLGAAGDMWLQIYYDPPGVVGPLILASDSLSHSGLLGTISRNLSCSNIKWIEAETAITLAFAASQNMGLDIRITLIKIR
jgi:hypothetical protein